MTEPLTSQEICELLDGYRPDRYDPEDKTWMEPVIDKVAAEIDAYEARRQAASQRVSNSEGLATRRTNQMIREAFTTGEWPLGWMDALSWPLAVNGHLRVRLGAASADDLAEFAVVERRNAAHDFAVRNETCEAAEAFAERIKSEGVTLLRELS